MRYRHDSRVSVMTPSGALRAASSDVTRRGMPELSADCWLKLQRCERLQNMEWREREGGIFRALYPFATIYALDLNKCWFRPCNPRGEVRTQLVACALCAATNRRLNDIHCSEQDPQHTQNVQIEHVRVDGVPHHEGAAISDVQEQNDQVGQDEALSVVSPMILSTIRGIATLAHTGETEVTLNTHHVDSTA